NALLGLRQECFFLIDDVLVRFGIQSKKHVPLLQRDVRCDRHVDDATPDAGQNRRYRKVDPRSGRERMIIAHYYQQQRTSNDPAKCCSRKRPLIHGYAEELENYVADRDVSQNEQEFHRRPPTSVISPGSSDVFQTAYFA